MFDSNLIEASLSIAILIAFLGGFLSFISPCVLPIVPPYLIFLAGNNTSKHKDFFSNYKMFYTSVFFVLGLSSVFVFLGLAMSTLGSIFVKYQTEMGYISGLIVFIFGVHYIGIFKISLLEREARFSVAKFGNSIVSPYILGLAFAFGWTPCIGPILGAILSITAQETNINKGIYLMFSYAMGLGIPFILIAAFFEKSQKILKKIKFKSDIIKKFTGIFLILIGVFLFTGYFQNFSFWLIDNFPILSTFG